MDKINAAIEIVKKFPNIPVVVIGDMIADIYLDGRIARVSREAPVLVLEYEKEKIFAGGAANVAQNILSLGGKAYIIGLIGEDSAGQQLRDKLLSWGADCSGLLTTRERPTTSKTRITAGGNATVRQQIVRVDREDRQPLTAELQKEINDEAVRKISNGANAVILSDYGSGMLTNAIGQGIIGLSRLRKVPCMVDSRYAINSFWGADFVKQNESETATALGINELTDGQEAEQGLQLLQNIKAGALLLTRGPDGMDLIMSDGCSTYIPVHNVSEVFDVTGAGDTMIAAFMLSIAVGAEPQMAAYIANAAAGVAVRKWGAAAVSATELIAAIMAEEEDA